jgi:fatty-acyl-CoA synthase
MTGVAADDRRVGSGATVGALLRDQARASPERIALEFEGRTVSYGALMERAECLAAALKRRGVTRGQRVAVLSENRPEYVEIALAVSLLGALVGCQNWRMARAELQHCITLLGPSMVFVSQRFRAAIDAVDVDGAEIVAFGDAYERLIADSARLTEPCLAAPEDGLTVIYTSGTTGVPKGAVISQRAMLARAMTNRIDHPCDDDESFIAWAPMFHIASTDAIFATLLRGAKVVLMDGFDQEKFADTVSREKIGHLAVMPGIISKIIDEFSRRRIVTRARYAGVTADLVPPEQLAELTRLLNVPYCNSFGSTETGWPPFSRSLVPIGVAPTRLSKRKSSYCAVRLVDEEGRDVADGVPGDVLFSGPTLFSGYLNANHRPDMAGDWYAMGDVFVRNPDGTFDFVDRAKYLIKSGGENIYPAEIERIVAELGGVEEVAVVRRPDPRWGEVPVVCIVRRDPALSADEVLASLNGRIAGYKLPRSVLFVERSDFRRGDNGKLDRGHLERTARE